MSWTQLRNCLCVALVLAGTARTAHGAMLYSDTLLASGTEFMMSIDMPVIDTEGEYKVTVTDLKWFNTPAQALSFGIFTAAGPIKTLPSAGTIQFFKGTGRASLLVYARPGGPRLADLIGVQVETVGAVVALPSSLLLLASALGGSALLHRRRQARDAVVSAFARFAPV